MPMSRPITERQRNYLIVRHGVAASDVPAQYREALHLIRRLDAERQNAMRDVGATERLRTIERRPKHFYSDNTEDYGVVPYVPLSDYVNRTERLRSVAAHFGITVE